MRLVDAPLSDITVSAARSLVMICSGVFVCAGIKTSLFCRPCLAFDLDQFGGQVRLLPGWIEQNGKVNTLGARRWMTERGWPTDLPPLVVPLAMLVRQAFGWLGITSQLLVPAACIPANCVA